MASEKATNWYWPKIVDVRSAVAASDLGFWAAAVVASITTVFATIALLAQSDFASINAWAYIDAVLFGLIAWRVRRRSRVFAVAGVLLFVWEKIAQFSNPGTPTAGVILAIVLLLLFVNGARGTFAYHRFSQMAASSAA